LLMSLTDSISSLFNIHSSPLVSPLYTGTQGKEGVEILVTFFFFFEFFFYFLPLPRVI
jgi:hypothetical protein